MSDLARLRERALHHLTSRTVRYSVCLNPDTREELRKLAELLQTAAQAGATEAAQQSVDPTARRTIGSGEAPSLTDLKTAAEAVMRPLEERSRELLHAAAAADELVVVVFGMPPEARTSPAEWYEQFKAQYPAPTLQEAQLLRDLVGASYDHTEAPDGQDLGLDWAEVAAGVLNHADLELLDQAVLELYRGASAIPFDPASFGRPPKS